MSFFQNFFGAGNTAGVAAQPQNQSAGAQVPGQGVQPVQQGQGQGQQQQGQQQQQQQVVAPQNQSPLDSFAEIWQTPTNVQNQAPNFAADAISFDATQMQAIRQKVSSINFMAGASAETVQQALAGNVEAFNSVINSAVQQALLQSMQLSGAMVNQGLRGRSQELLTHFPEIVRQQLASQQLRQDNPLFSNPATKPVLEALESALVRNQPNLTPQQVSQVAQSYLQEFAKNLIPQSPVQQTQQAAGTEWDSFFK